MINITFAHAVEGIRAVIAEQEDGESYVYRKLDGKCVYVEPDGSGSCLVGRYLIKAGVPVEELRKLDRPVSGTTIRTALRRLEERGVLDYTWAAAAYLAAAQSSQDIGATWGDAQHRALTCAQDQYGTNPK